MSINKKITQRTGIIGTKSECISMVDDGKMVCATIIEVARNTVIAQKKPEKDGYLALCVGYGEKKEGRMAKPELGRAKKAGISSFQLCKEFRISEDCLLEVGASIGVEHFVLKQKIDIWGISIGKGMAGVVKRWKFGGQGASHGDSVSHRSLGSTGTRKIKTRKNRKMAGHLGHNRVTVQNLEIIDIDPARGIILVKGSIPGPKGGIICISDAKKRLLPHNVPLPTANLAAAA